MDADRLSSISKADTLEKMGEFWDTHDFTDFDTDAPDVETLVNLWLQQKLVEQTQSVAV